MTTLKDALIKAWDRTEPCPDGVYSDAPFCPDCLYKSLWLVLEEGSTRVLKAVKDGE